MKLIPINLATEDELSEITLDRLLEALNRFTVGFRYRKGGFGYLRKTIHGWNQAAKGTPYVVLTDLDAANCASELINSWLPLPKNPNLLFRVAVREVESWLLADAENFSKFIGVTPSLIPVETDRLSDPKATLIQLAAKSRFRYIREDIVPRRGSTAKQGPDYNGCLGKFVREFWSPDIARNNSPSLARTLDRLASFTPIWPNF